MFVFGTKGIIMAPTPRALPHRWVCSCRVPPLVLGSFDLQGHLALEHQERYWLVNRRVTTNCPGCGKQHRLELELDPDVLASLPGAWQPNTS